MSSATLRIEAVQHGDWFQADRSPKVLAPVRRVMKERLRERLMAAAHRAERGERAAFEVDWETIGDPDAEHEAFAAEFAACWDD